MISSYYKFAIEQYIIMSKLVCLLEAKKFQALINGLSKSLYFNESSIFTQQYFHETLFGNGDVDIVGIISFFKQLIAKFAENNWDVSQVEENLTQLEEEITSDQRNVFIYFWSNEHEKVWCTPHP